MRGRSQDCFKVTSRPGELEPDVERQFVGLGQPLARQGLQFRRFVPKVEYDDQVVGPKVPLGCLRKVEDALVEDLVQTLGECMRTE